MNSINLRKPEIPTNIGYYFDHLHWSTVEFCFTQWDENNKSIHGIDRTDGRDDRMDFIAHDVPHRDRGYGAGDRGKDQTATHDEKTVTRPEDGSYRQALSSNLVQMQTQSFMGTK